MTDNVRLLAKDTYTVKVKKIRMTDMLMLCIAPLFIFNPETAVIDIIPDFIGYLLMLIPLLKLRDLTERFEDAVKHIWIALFVNVGKYAALMLSFGAIGQQEGGSESSLMMFSLVMAVLDIIFVTSAFRVFFDAFGKLGLKHECHCISGSKIKMRRGIEVRSSKTFTDKISRATTVFIIARALCYALPEFSTASAHTIDDTAFDWYKFTALFRVFGIFIGFIFGIVWLVRVLIYFIRVAADKQFLASLNEEYVRIAPTLKTRFILRNIGAIVSAVGIAVFFCADVCINNNAVNVIPDCIFAFVFLCALWCSRSLFAKNKRVLLMTAIPTSVLFVTSLAKDIVRYSYFNRYDIKAYAKLPAAYDLYNFFTAISVADAVALVVTVISICGMISFINSQYAISKLSREDESVMRMKDEDRAEYRKQYLLPVKILSVISGLLIAIAPYMYTFANNKLPNVENRYATAEYYLMVIGSSYWFVELLASILLAIFVRRALSELKERSETNLMLD